MATWSSLFKKEKKNRIKEVTKAIKNKNHQNQRENQKEFIKINNKDRGHMIEDLVY